MTKKERTGVVYMATVNNKSYIGQTIDFKERKRVHSLACRDTHFHRAIRKYGADSVRWEILEDNIPEIELNNREIHWIEVYDTYHNGYNMTLGGESNPMKNPDVAAKISAGRLEKSANGGLHSQISRERMSATHKSKVARGEHHTQHPEHGEKISLGHTKRRLRDYRESGQSFLFDIDTPG